MKKLVRYIHLNTLDERILGDSDFVEHVLKVSDEQMEQKDALKASGYDFDCAVQRVAQVLGMKPDEVTASWQNAPNGQGQGAIVLLGASKAWDDNCWDIEQVGHVPISGESFIKKRRGHGKRTQD